MKGALPLPRNKLLALLALSLAAAGAATLVAIVNSGSARATNASVVAQAQYSVLTGTATGDAASSVPPSTSTGEGNNPIGSTITNVDIGNHTLTVTVAWSTEGGVCVFVERHGARGAGGSCGDAALLDRGAKAELHEDNGPTTLAGVVPDGVSAVRVGFADGTSETVNVAHNAWAIERAPAGMTSATNVVGGAR